jgi:hypothetical protein
MKWYLKRVEKPPEVARMWICPSSLSLLTDLIYVQVQYFIHWGIHYRSNKKLLTNATEKSAFMISQAGINLCTLQRSIR